MYTRESRVEAPEENDDDLLIAFTAQDEADVAAHDYEYVAQPATINQYAVFLFKDQHTNNTDKFKPTWIGMADHAPSISTVYLQVFNRTFLRWDTIDSNSTAGSREEFTLTSWVDTNLDQYYDSRCVVSCRVYQEATP